MTQEDDVSLTEEDKPPPEKWGQKIKNKYACLFDIFRDRPDCRSFNNILLQGNRLPKGLFIGVPVFCDNLDGNDSYR